jgi:hypothetical protein
MKSLSLLILLSTCCHITFAQFNIKGIVSDAETKMPIPYVNIGIKNSAIGTVSDLNGNYHLDLKKKDGIVTFSSIGYETINIPVNQLSKDNNVELIFKDYALEAVEIVAHKFAGEEEIFGVKNKTRGLSIGFGSRQLGTEIGALIQIEEPTFIKSANFVLNHASGDSLLFRVNIYSHENNQQGEKVLKENIFIKAKQKRGLITVDLSSFNLILENDALLTLEWIKDDKGNGNTDITFDTKKSNKLKGVYIKNSSIGEFETMGYINSKLKPCFFLWVKGCSDKTMYGIG